MIIQYNAYLLEVKTTGGLGDTFKIKDGHYFECNDGKIIILTSDLSFVIQNIGQENISVVKELGIGYLIEKQ